MNLMDNDSTASLTDREKSLLVALSRCLSFLADLNGSSFIDGDDAGSIDMRQRSKELQRLAINCIDSDMDLYRAVYGDSHVE